MPEETSLGITIRARDDSQAIEQARARMQSLQAQARSLTQELARLSQTGLTGATTSGFADRLKAELTTVETELATLRASFAETAVAAQASAAAIEKSFTLPTSAILRAQRAIDPRAMESVVGRELNTAEIIRATRATEAYIASQGRELTTAQLISAQRSQARVTAQAESQAAREIERARQESQKFVSSVPILAPRVQLGRFDPELGRFRELGEEGEKAGRRAASGISAVAPASSVATREVRHLVAGFDELSAGRRGQFFSTLGASLRDAGIAMGPLLTGIAVLGAFMAAARFSAMVEKFGELAEKTRNAAAASNLSVEQYSTLQRTMQLVTGDASSLERAFGALEQRMQTAIEEPFSKIRTAFSEIQISGTQLQEGLKNPAEMLELLRERFQQMPGATAQFREILGARGFQEFISYLRQSSEELGKLKTSAQESGSIFSTEVAEGLSKASEDSKKLGESMTGLGISLSALAGNTGFINFLREYVNGLRELVDYHNQLAVAASKMPQVTTETQRRLDALKGSVDPNTGMFVPGRYIPGTPAAVPGGAGLSSDFQTRLKGLEEAAKAQGIDISVASGYRSPERQAQLFAEAVSKYGSEAAARAHVAPPGRSLHNMGLAADLRYGPGGEEFARQHAQEFGLTFPMAYEPWHIEPIGARAGGKFAGPMSVPSVPMSVPAPTAPAMSVPAPVVAPRDIKENYERDIKELQDSGKLRIAEFTRQEAEAAHHEDQVEAIRKRRAVFEEQQAVKEKEIQDKYRAQAQQAGVRPTDPFMRQLDPTGAQVKATEAQASAIRATTSAQDQAARMFELDERAKIDTARYTAQQTINDAKASGAAKIAAAENEASTIESVYREMETKIAAQYGQESTQYKQLENERINAAREASTRIANIRKQEAESTLRDAERAGKALELQRKGTELQFKVQETVARMGGPGDVNKIQMQAAQQDAAMSQAAAAQKISALQAIIDKYGQESEVGKKAAEEIVNVQEKALAQQVQDYEKAAAAWEKAHAGLTRFLDSVGSAFESGLGNIVKSIISPQVEIIHAGLTTIRETHRGRQIAQAIGNMLTSVIEDGVKEVSKSLLKSAFSGITGSGAETVGGGLSNIIAKALGTGGAAPQAANFGITTANLQSFNAALAQATAALSTHGGVVTTASSAQTLNTSSTTLNTTATSTGTATETTRNTIVAANSLTTGANTVATSTNTLATEANSTAQSAGGVGGFLKGIPIIGGLFSMFAQGGIVSAQGGMVVGGLGATLAMLHPNEMVLPSRISQTIQNLTNYNSMQPAFAGHSSVNYAPNINMGGKSNMSRSEFSTLLSGHASDIVGEMRNLMRSGRRFR